MIGLALDHAAERDHAVIRRALGFWRIDRHGDGGRHFQRARHRQAVILRAGLVQHTGGAREQRVGNMFIKPRFHDQHA